MTYASPSPAEIKLMLHRCGLSQTDAADYLDREARIVRRWIAGDYPIPAEHWQRLVDLCARQDRIAAETLATIRQQVAEIGEDPEEVSVRLARSDDEARALGWPSAAAHLAVIRRVVERAPPGLRIVPAWRDDDAAADGAAVVRGTVARP